MFLTSSRTDPLDLLTVNRTNSPLTRSISVRSGHIGGPCRISPRHNRTRSPVRCKRIRPARCRSAHMPTKVLSVCPWPTLVASGLRSMVAGILRCKRHRRAYRPDLGFDQGQQNPAVILAELPASAFLMISPPAPPGTGMILKSKPSFLCHRTFAVLLIQGCCSPS